jgi:hypothetical protein
MGNRDSSRDASSREMTIRRVDLGVGEGQLSINFVVLGACS